MSTDTPEVSIFPFEHDVPAPPPERRRLLALVHILTPDFQGLNPADFADISDEMVAAVAPDELRPFLFWEDGTRPFNQGKSDITYRPEAAPERSIHVALTPHEYKLITRSIRGLAKAALNDVLDDRDEMLRQQTEDPTVRARSDEDLRAADRGSVRFVKVGEARMRGYLDEEISPRIALTAKFKEMTLSKSFNLVRGTDETVRNRFEYLRNWVFGDMLDAITTQRGWQLSSREVSIRALQKRLYLEPKKTRRLANFRDMIVLAERFYGHKYASFADRIAGSQRFYDQYPEIVADIEKVDRQRRAEAAGQLSLESEQN